EIAVLSVDLAAGDDRRVGLRVADVFTNLLVGTLVDHGADKVPEVPDIAHLHLFHHRDDTITHSRPDGARHIDTARRRTFLALILESASGDRDRERLRVGGGVRDDEILSTGLADDAGICRVPTHPGADRLP